MLDTREPVQVKPRRIKGGDRVRIRIGAMVFGTNPSKPEIRINRSSKPVIVENVFPEGGQTKITWTAQGSYWSWADESDAVFID